MITIIDNALSVEEMSEVQNFFINNEDTRNVCWLEGSYKKFFNYGSPLSKILSHANNFLDLSSMVGCEYWSHYNTKPDWHFDKDEKVFETTGEIKTPICSIVYYAYINNLTGGKFLTKDVQITPVQNRLLIFSPLIWHSVEDYEGDRLSIAVNPWECRVEP